MERVLGIIPDLKGLTDSSGIHVVAELEAWADITELQSHTQEVDRIMTQFQRVGLTTEFLLNHGDIIVSIDRAKRNMLAVVKGQPNPLASEWPLWKEMRADLLRRLQQVLGELKLAKGAISQFN